MKTEYYKKVIEILEKYRSHIEIINDNGFWVYNISNIKNIAHDIVSKLAPDGKEDEFGLVDLTNVEPDDISFLKKQPQPEQDDTNMADDNVQKECYHWECKHFDECQGRNLCYNSKIKSKTCIGVDCGELESSRAEPEHIEDYPCYNKEHSDKLRERTTDFLAHPIQRAKMEKHDK